MPPSLQGQDKMVWMLTSSGEFSIASAYELVRRVSSSSLLFPCVWHKSIPVKISFFMLRLLCFKLSFMQQLRGFGIQGPSWCFFCQDALQEEDVDHVFCTSELAR